MTSPVKSDSDLINWAIERSRSRSRKTLPWHELQEIAFAIEHGLTEADALAQAEATPEPLSITMPPTGRQKHDVDRVAHLRNLVTATSWPQAEREYDKVRDQVHRKLL